MSSSGILTGTAGVYHVMSELSLRDFHAAATHGNAPDFDILVCSSKGDKSVAIQVKSTRWATRERKRETRVFLDFPLGYKAGKLNRKTILFAFVDFGVSPNQKPDVYLIPSTWLHDFCKDWIDKYEGKMVRFKPEAEWVEKFKNNWDPLKDSGIIPESSTNGDENTEVGPSEADPSTSSG